MFTIPIVYEDNHLLVADKPPNILSQKDSTGDIDMLTLLKQDIKMRYNKPGNVYLGLVHRLDRPVGGVMLFAKTSKSAARLSEQIKRQELSRTYLALIHGQPSKHQSTLVHYLLKDDKRNLVSVVRKDMKGAKEAILDYHVVRQQADISLVKVKLRTGRPHQIRVQFAHLGHPLYGDQRYGRNPKTIGQQIGLWSYEISCLHPITKKNMKFNSSPFKHKPWSQFQSQLDII
ncbi:23S RNA-specific pseudouridylate synthase [Desulfitobacterium dehalogenans ATCC 51507]|uniref:RNA pseudouridylate synthase n=1 Tax=Desulfitobacterium dehalogenans (strain ATCC 51507 / DSM 9161 / JW/IU-DC1) TaxID=756499 RepID=I4A4P0_DESDJ|nr:RluA family pseudouridine synthase [Desulfitobacterium dehalogenans]AFL98924.1 23S RNA-specific pseudouridylate synthase [Desulfitobacterium dehalogenans ATCC 51507]